MSTTTGSPTATPGRKSMQASRRSMQHSRLSTDDGGRRRSDALPTFSMMDFAGGPLGSVVDGAILPSRETMGHDDGRTSMGRRSMTAGRRSASRARPSMGALRETATRTDDVVDESAAESGKIPESGSQEQGTQSNEKYALARGQLPSDMPESEYNRLAFRVKLKTDAALIILMALVVMLQYLDKAIFSYAAILGLQRDNQITDGQYSFAASFYYIGMIVGLPLWTFALQLLTTDIVLGATVVSWGAVTMCHAATHDYGGILAVRFFLGFLESAVTPALVLTTGTFYTQVETISRTAFWYSFNGVALILGGGLSYGLLTNPSVIRSSLAIWRQLYLILGGISVFLGLLILAFMPNHPSTTRLFTPRERQAAVVRLAKQQAQSMPQEADLSLDEETDNHIPYTAPRGGVLNPRRRFALPSLKNIQWDQFAEGVRDPRLYLFFAGLLVGSVPNGGVTAFSTQLLAGFGFSVQQTLLVSIAPGGGQIVSVLLFIAVALITRSRILGANTLLCIAIAGSTMMYVSSTGRTAKTVGYVLLNFGSPAVVALYSFIGSAVQGHGKRVLFTIVSQLAYALGNIIGPLVFLPSEVLINYPTAKRTIIGTLAGAAFTLFAVGAIHMLWNSRRDKRAAREEEQGIDEMDDYDETEFAGLTDFKDKTYRYVY